MDNKISTLQHGNEHLNAKKGLRLRDEKDSTRVQKVMTAVINLIGLKQSPTMEQKIMIERFLAQDLGRFTSDEVLLAFRMVASNKLSGIDHYGTLSPQYIGKVMTAYEDYTQQKKLLVQPIVEQPKEPTEVEKREIINDGIRTIIDQWNEVKEGKKKYIRDDYGYVYDTLQNNGIVRHEADLKIKVLEKEKQRIIETGCSDITRRKDFKKFIGGEEDNYFYRKAIKRAKKHLLNKFIDECIEVDRDLESELNGLLN